MNEFEDLANLTLNANNQDGKKTYQNQFLKSTHKIIIEEPDQFFENNNFMINMKVKNNEYKLKRIENNNHEEYNTHNTQNESKKKQ